MLQCVAACAAVCVDSCDTSLGYDETRYVRKRYEICDEKRYVTSRDMRYVTRRDMSHLEI